MGPSPASEPSSWSRIRRIVAESDTPGGRRFDYLIQSLIVISLISFSVETLPNLDPATRRVLDWIEVATVFVFTAEYILRVLLAEKKLEFVTSFFGIVDLLAILPFHVTSGIDLRSLRALRLLRLFRALKLIRYRRAVRRIHRALGLVKEELVLFFSNCGEPNGTPVPPAAYREATERLSRGESVPE